LFFFQSKKEAKFLSKIIPSVFMTGHRHAGFKFDHYNGFITLVKPKIVDLWKKKKQN